MNLDNLKKEIASHINERVTIKVFGMRNKTNIYHGYIKDIYPNLFTIKNNNFEKSFTYRDLITGEISIKYE